MQRNKTMATMIALFLVLTITATLVALPIVNAHTPAWTVPTSAYCVAVPDRIGLGQYTTIVVWLDRYSPTGTGTEGQFWDGFKIDITKPDGTNVTIGPFTCGSAVASDFRTYTPDKVGTYTIVFSWPGETVTNGTGSPNPSGLISLGDFYQGSTSAPATLIVQQEPIQGWQEPPLPTDYWQTPINDANRGWSTLASNWLGGTWLVNNFQRWGKAPNSAHVLWTMPITPGRAGGINDAQWPGIPSDVNDYESPWSSPIIMNGKIYYNTPSVGDSVTYGYYCVDLYTGKQIWYKNGTDNGLNNPVTMTTGTFGGILPSLAQSYPRLSLGQLKYYYSVNGQGILAYLWMQMGTTWYMLDAATGNLMLTLINVPGGQAVTDQDGNLLLYSYKSTTGQILCWNSSQAIYPGGVIGTGQQQWKPRLGGVIDAVNDTSWSYGPWAAMNGIDPALLSRPHSGYTMNVTGPVGLPTSIAFGAAASGMSAVLQDDHRVPKELFGFYKGTGSSIGSPPDPDTFSVWTIRIDDHVTNYSPIPGQTANLQNNLGFGATLLLNKNITVPLPGKNYTWNLAGVSYDDQVFTLRCSQTMQIWGYSLETGAMLWGPTTSFHAMDFYGISANMYYGKVLECSSYGGTLTALDAKTGEILWVYNATAPGYESAYGENMPLSIGAVADGKVFLYSSEHSPTKPLWRASYLRCVNVTDGKELWKLLDFNMGLGIADGYIVTGSQYDNLVYCIGKGPSAVTVDAPMTAITATSNVVLRGTVTDQSPGAKGTPAIADADMQAWMEYLYEQQAMPTNAKGVEVTLDAVDPNGNFIHIGTATSDISGTFGYAWTTPDVPGKYTIIATFAGSESYGSSYAETYAVLSEAPATPTPPPVAAPLPPYEMYTIGTGIAIIIAVAIVGILLLRRRP